MPRKSVSEAQDGFGRWLRDERSKQGLTLDDLARRTKLTAGTISNYERGFRRASREKVIEVALALSQGVSSPEATGIMNSALLSGGFAPSEQAVDMDLVKKALAAAEVALSEARGIVASVPGNCQRIRSMADLKKHLVELGIQYTETRGGDIIIEQEGIPTN
jgi:transcriptional regulator with XRE-family HTH domain